MTNWQFFKKEKKKKDRAVLFHPVDHFTTQSFFKLLVGKKYL